MINILIVTLILLTLWGLCYDDRITKQRLLIIMVIIILLVILAFYYDKMSYVIIKDLFWYSVLMLTSLIFHALWLKWAYDYCEKKEYEYLCFIISRISVLFSISILLYLLGRLHKLMYEGIKRYNWTIKEKKGEDSTDNYFNYRQKKAKELYEKYYTKKGVKLLLFYGYLVNEYKIIKGLHSILIIVILIMQLCLGFFVNNFNNYCILVLGINNNQKMLIKDYIKKFIQIASIFLITFSGAYLLGFSSRLYFIWMILFIWKVLDFLLFFKKGKTYPKYIYYMFTAFFAGNWFSLFTFLTFSQMTRFKDFKLIYGKKMFYNLKYFILPIYTNINMWTCWDNFINCHWHPTYRDDLTQLIKKPYPMVSYFKYYKPIELAKGEYERNIIFHQSNDPTAQDIMRWVSLSWDEVLVLCKKFNINENKYKEIALNLPGNLSVEDMQELIDKMDFDSFLWSDKEEKFILNKK